MVETRQRIIVGAAFLLFSGVAFGQQSTEAPVFHGLKLGLTLGSQINKCTMHRYSTGSEKVEGSGENCFNDLGIRVGATASIDIMTIGTTVSAQELPTDKRAYLVVALVPTGSTEIMDATIESVELEYDMGEASGILGSLKAKFGEPVECEQSTKQSGLGVSVNAVACSWKASWGLIAYYAPAEKIGKLKVVAATTKYIKYADQWRREHSTKRQSEF